MFQLYASHRMIYQDDRQLQTRLHDGPVSRPPSRCTTVFMKSFLYQGMILWNQLPILLRINGDYEVFKMQVKQLMLDREATIYGEWSMVSEPTIMLPIVT